MVSKETSHTTQTGRTGEINRGLRRAVAGARDLMDVPQSTFARYLRSEARIAGAYHDPAAYAPNDTLREAVKGAYQQYEGSLASFRKQLRELANGYEEAPEMEGHAVSSGNRGDDNEHEATYE